jgi:hypothetical protein
VGGQRHAAAALSPTRTRYPLYRRLGGPQGRSGRVRKISPPPGFDPRTIHPVASRYTELSRLIISAVHDHELYRRLTNISRSARTSASQQDFCKPAKCIAGCAVSLRYEGALSCGRARTCRQCSQRRSVGTAQWQLTQRYRSELEGRLQLFCQFRSPCSGDS